MERQKKAFQELKKRFTKKLVLTALDLDQKLRMEVNASDYAINGVLSIECENERWKLVAFLSKSLNQTKRNYNIHNKDILVVIRGLEN